MAKSPSRFFGKQAVKSGALPWFRHHLRDRVTPTGIVDGFLVPDRGIIAAIHLDQNEAGRIIDFLHNIKPCDTGLGKTMAGVLSRSRLESFNALRFHMNVNVDNEHG